MVAINSDFISTKTETTHTQSLLQKISETGFSHVHWVHDWDGVYLYSTPEMLQIREWVDQYQLKVKGVHATDGFRDSVFDDRKIFISPLEANRIAGVELVMNRIDLAKILDAGAIVLHAKLNHVLLPNSKYQMFTERFWEQTFRSFDEIIAHATKQGIKVAIENMFGPDDEIQFEQFDRLFDRYSSDQLGLCFDSGHNMICNKDKPFSFLERYADRLSVLHLNCSLLNEEQSTDYEFIRALDVHNVPETNCINCSLYNLEQMADDKDMLNSDVHNIPKMNCFNYNKLAQLIADSPYELPITFEVAINRDFETGLQNTLKVGNRLTKLIEKIREER